MDKEFWLKLIEINPKYKEMLKTNSCFYTSAMYLSRRDSPIIHSGTTIDIRHWKNARMQRNRRLRS